VQRLQQRLADARAIGLKVRLEMFDGEQATWCEIAGVPTLFVDLSQTAAEQLRQVEETLAAYARGKSTPEEGHLHAVPPPQTEGGLEKQAA
jgi:hypothetical protein